MRFHDDESAAIAVKKAVERDVNYFDVAPGYGGGTAEPRLGLGIQGLDRSKLIVTAKSSPGNGAGGVGESYSPQTGFGIRTADQARTQIERSIKVIGVDHLDVYHLWACHGDAVFEEAMKPGGFLEGVRKAHDEGLLDYIGITTHMDSDGIIRYCEAFDFAMVTIPFHLRDTSRSKAVKWCAENGIAVIAMNPLAGGALARPAPVLQKIATDLGFANMTEAALRFLVSYPGVTTALNGLTYVEQVIEGTAAIRNGEVSAETAEMLRFRVQELYENVQHFCTACGYCGDCASGLSIPSILESYSGLLVPSLADDSAEQLAHKLARDPDGHDPALCAACKSCEDKCPNRLPISDLMAAASKMWHRG